MIRRHRNALIVADAPVLIFIFVASISFSVLVASGRALFPLWMTAINPVTMAILCPLLKRILPPLMRAHTQAA
jgi:hypothetical protein